MTPLSPCLASGCPELVAGESYCRRHKARNKIAAARQLLTPCLVATCPNLVAGYGHCDRHRHRGPNAGRRKPNPWRTGNWLRIAAAYLDAHPTCEYPHCTAPAILVHHRDGSGRRGAGANNSDENLESLCSTHHGRRHHELHHAGVVRLGPTGGAEGGLPGPGRGLA